MTIVVSLLTGGEKDEAVLREVDRIHGWRDYNSERYNGKLFPLGCAALALFLMVWSAMPNNVPPSPTASTTTNVAQR